MEDFVGHSHKKKIKERVLLIEMRIGGKRGDMDVADLAAMGLVGLDVDALMGVPEAEGSVLAATEAVVSVPVEADS